VRQQHRPARPAPPAPQCAALYPSCWHSTSKMSDAVTSGALNESRKEAIACLHAKRLLLINARLCCDV
jgi:hypothetical protein